MISAKGTIRIANAENPDKLETVYNLLKRFGADQVYNALKRIKDYQGLPLASDIFERDFNSLSEDMKIISEAIRRGVVRNNTIQESK